MSDFSVNKVIVDPILVDELTEEDIKYGMTDEASAIITINNKQYDIPKQGCSFLLDSPLDLSTSTSLRGKLYMYDRQPNNGACFRVNSSILKPCKDNTLHLSFFQMGPAICFSLNQKVN